METSIAWLNRIATRTLPEDWQRLIATYAPLFYSWLNRAGIPIQDQDDLVQETLVAVFQKIPDFERRGRGAFRGWLRAIVINQSRKYFRDSPHQVAFPIDEIAKDDSHLARQWDREHDEYLTASALKAVESEFAPETWKAFRAQVFDNLKPADVAVRLGVSLNSVLLSKSRVLKRLRMEVKDLLKVADEK